MKAYTNLDNQYIRAIVNRKYGKVLVVRGTAPTMPKTFKGDSKMGNGEAKDMGACFPQGRYITTSAFETAVPCLVEKR